MKILKLALAAIIMPLAGLGLVASPSQGYQNIVDGALRCEQYVEPSTATNMHSQGYSTSGGLEGSNTANSAAAIRNGNEDVDYWVAWYNLLYYQPVTHYFLAEQWHCRILGPNSNLNVYTVEDDGLMWIAEY